MTCSRPYLVSWERVGVHVQCLQPEIDSLVHINGSNRIFNPNIFIMSVI